MIAVFADEVDDDYKDCRGDENLCRMRYKLSSVEAAQSRKKKLHGIALIEMKYSRFIYLSIWNLTFTRTSRGS
jgi:hypothetical protein